MKTLRFFGMVLIAALLCVNFTSCGSDDEEVVIEKVRANAEGYTVKYHGEPTSYGAPYPVKKENIYLWINEYVIKKYSYRWTSIEADELDENKYTQENERYQKFTMDAVYNELSEAYKYYNLVFNENTYLKICTEENFVTNPLTYINTMRELYRSGKYDYITFEYGEATVFYRTSSVNY